MKARHQDRSLRVEIDDPAVRLDLNMPGEYECAYTGVAARVGGTG